MLLIILFAVVSSHILAVSSYLSLPSHFKHAGLSVGLGLVIGMENSRISTLFYSLAVWTESMTLLWQ